MSRLALCLLLLATSASASDSISVDIPYGITRFKDTDQGVTCYTARHSNSGVGISCIPDSQMQAGNERQLSPHEQKDNGPTPAATQGQLVEEGYSL